MRSDDAEAFLQEHDPQYGRSKRGWKDIRRSGHYVAPRQEIPWGSAGDLAELVAAGQQYVERAERKTCDKCFTPFVPVTPWQRFCTSRCRLRAFRATSETHSS